MAVSFMCPQCGQASDYGATLVAGSPASCMACTFLTSGPTLPASQPDEDQLDADADRLARLRQMRVVLDCALAAIARLNAWPWKDVGSPVTGQAIQDAAVAASRARNMLDNDITRADRRFPSVPPARPGGW